MLVTQRSKPDPNPNQPSHRQGAEQEIEPQIDPGAVGPRAWHQLDAAVYTLSPVRFCAAEPQPISSADISRLANCCRSQKTFEPNPDPAGRVEGNPVDPGETIRRAASEQLLLVQTQPCCSRNDCARFSRQSVGTSKPGKKISAQIADEHQDVKKISGQISALTAKVNSLQNLIAPMSHLHFSKRA